jgi:hypothetical protein
MKGEKVLMRPCVPVLKRQFINWLNATARDSILTDSIKRLGLFLVILICLVNPGIYTGGQTVFDVGISSNHRVHEFHMGAGIITGSSLFLQAMVFTIQPVTVQYIL